MVRSKFLHWTRQDIICKKKRAWIESKNYYSAQTCLCFRPKNSRGIVQAPADGAGRQGNGAPPRTLRLADKPFAGDPRRGRGGPSYEQACAGTKHLDTHECDHGGGAGRETHCQQALVPTCANDSLLPSSAPKSAW
jgi:hypothetical protein